MNELSDLIIKDKADEYIVELKLTPDEYRIFMFAIEDQTKIYEKTIPLGIAFNSLKEKIIASHVLNNISKMRKPRQGRNKNENNNCRE